MPGILDSSAWRNLRRRSKAVSIAARPAWVLDFSLKAASAPYWAKELAFEVIWLWSSAIALATAGGATVVPRRQPVMAYVLENPETMRVRAWASAPQKAGLKCFTPS